MPATAPPRSLTKSVVASAINFGRRKSRSEPHGVRIRRHRTASLRKSHLRHRYSMRRRQGGRNDLWQHAHNADAHLMARYHPAFDNRAAAHRALYLMGEQYRQPCTVLRTRCSARGFNGLIAIGVDRLLRFQSTLEAAERDRRGCEAATRYIVFIAWAFKVVGVAPFILHFVFCLQSLDYGLEPQSVLSAGATARCLSSADGRRASKTRCASILSPASWAALCSVASRLGIHAGTNRRRRCSRVQYWVGSASIHRLSVGGREPCGGGSGSHPLCSTGQQLPPLQTEQMPPRCQLTRVARQPYGRPTARDRLYRLCHRDRHWPAAHSVAGDNCARALKLWPLLQPDNPRRVPSLPQFGTKRHRQRRRPSRRSSAKERPSRVEVAAAVRKGRAAARALPSRPLSAIFVPSPRRH